MRLILPRPFPILLFAVLAPLCLAAPPAQQTPVPTPPAAGQPGQQDPQPQPGQQDPAAGGSATARPEGKEEDSKKKQKPVPGIPVEDLLVHANCVRCHALDDRQHMTRISYLRKSPEGWSRTLKRMIRLHGLQLSPADAKQIVRSLANTHGLTRSEARRGLYESERRVHWSEEHHEQDFRRACAQCHPLGRVLLEYRNEEEWQLLRATHVAMFPLSQRQLGGGAPRDDRSRGGPPPEIAAAMAAQESSRGRSSSGSRSSGSSSGSRSSGSSSGSRFSGSSSGSRSSGSSRGNVGDRVLKQLASDQPLFSEAWKNWSKNRRTVPLAGTWSVMGHEVGRGDLAGTAVITRTGDDEYDIRWQLECTDGSTIDRAGKGLLYAGYSWRGRSQDGDVSWREVLLLDESWQQLEGRLFTGSHDEIGIDVTLHRDLGRARVLGLGNRAITVPATAHVLDVYGESFPDPLQAADFFIGRDVTITAVERVGERHARLTVDVAADAELGTRAVAFGGDPGSTDLLLYDTVDYVRITPLQGLSRVGGARHPTQIERFEAIAVNRGADKKPYTDDDLDLFQVRPTWGLEEFRVREDDDDVLYVGSIDPATGVFTPAVDGPNPDRKWSTNNIGDVFVTATIELEVPVRPPEKKDDEDQQKADGDNKTDDQDDKKGDDTGTKKADDDGNDQDPDQAVAAVPARERKTFRARSHLIVTVPLYVRWMALDWEDR